MRLPNARGLAPSASELVSLRERSGYLRAIRAAFALAAIATAALAPRLLGVPRLQLALVTAVYLLALAVPEITGRLARETLLPVIGATLLLDALYLAWLTYATGGAASPLRVLIYAHIVAVTLLASYRTGLKIAAWHSLLFFVVVYAERATILAVREPLLSSLPGRPDFAVVAILSVGAMWTIALATAAGSALNERELRAQKIDLEQLSAMVAEIDRRRGAGDIPRILLDKVCETFAFPRGIVLASPDDDLEVVAYRGSNVSARITPGLDPLMERAWSNRETVLAKTFDPDENPRLAEAIPGGRNMMVVPLLIEGDSRLGLMVIECATTVGHLKRWVVTIVEQFASHAALSLQNAWLLEQLEERLKENRALQAELMSQNLALETRVEERTQELTESLRDLRAVNMERRRLLARVVGAEEEERRRVANDIHDGPVQEIVVAGMQLHKLRKRLVHSEDVDVVDSVRASVDRSVEGLRGLLSQLRPEVLDRDGLASALEQLISTFDGGPVFTLTNDLEQEPSSEVRLALYRIAQEALNNIRKHAEASSVTVSLSQLDDKFFVRIEDDGVGFDPAVMLRLNPGHLGLSSMRERAQMVGGECRVRSLPTGGTTVEVWLPASVSEQATEHATEIPPTTPSSEDGARPNVTPLQSRPRRQPLPRPRRVTLPRRLPIASGQGEASYEGRHEAGA